METKTYLCPHCGNPIPLPEGLTEFSCMYCGIRMTRAELAPKEPELQESREAAAVLTEALPGMITGYPQTMENLAPGSFPAYFNAYIAQHDAVLQLAESLRQEALEPLCGAVIDRVGVWCSANTKAFESPEALLDKAKFTLCLVTVPAIRRCAPESGPALAEALRNAWLTKYPQNPFQLASYEEIAKGFERKRLCFITTAACRHLGKADDCRELTAFRQFRDGWLSRQPGGKAIIEEYYRIAPAIVTAIDFGGDPVSAYPALWENYLLPCYEALLQGDEAACFVHYRAMVHQLKAQYLKEAA